MRCRCRPNRPEIVPPDDLPFTVIRLLLKPGTWYEDQREAFRPFNRIVRAPDTGMRDEVAAVAWRALKRQKRVFILVNNKAEGSSPLTIAALAQPASLRRAERFAPRAVGFRAISAVGPKL